MANVLVTVALLLVGLALLAAGVFVYRTGVVLFGLLVGAGLGFFGASAAGLTGTPQIAVVLVLAVAGLFVARTLYYVIVVVPGAVTGFAAALFLTGTSFTPVGNLLDPVVLVSPLVGGVVAVLVQDLVVAVVSASWGAALLWAALATDEITAALADGSIPEVPTWVLGVAVVGAVVQVGLWLLTRRYDGDELRAKAMGLLGVGGDAETGPRSGV